jgi:hypothetical protein
MNDWGGVAILVGALSVLWLLKQGFDEGIERIIKKLDEVIEVLKKSGRE